MKNILILTSIIFLTSCTYLPVKNEVLFTDDNNDTVDNISQSFKILSWNIEKQDNPNWYSAFQSFLNKDNSPNIILLQEAKLNNDLRDKVKNKYWGFSPNLYSKGFYSGVLIASDIQPISMIPKISNGREPVFPFAKSMLFNIYKISPNKELLVVNIHALNFTAIKFWNIGSEFDEQIMLISNLVKNHNGPVIVAGDFNTWSSKRMSFLDSTLSKAGLIKNNFGNSKSKITTCPLPFLCNSNPLDHIFYRGLTPKLSRVELNKNSDHNPLIVEFDIN
jgi:endonuclease/exonuclease/phosphatase (EEP) superfamily protein YafD